MATVKVKFRASSSVSEEGTLFYRVIHNRTPRQIHTGYKLHTREWDAENEEIVFPPGAGEIRGNYLVSLRNAVQDDIRRLKGIILQLDRSGGAYTAEDVVRKYLSPTDSPCFISFARNLVRQLGEIGKHRTAET